MKLSCLQENLARGLGIVGRAVAVRSTLPITGHVLLATDGGRLKLSATNLEIALTCWIGSQIEEEGGITIPARLLTDFVNSLPSERIDMTLPARSRQLRLVCARNEATIGGMDADDFPPIPRVEGGEGLKLDPKSLRHGDHAGRLRRRHRRLAARPHRRPHAHGGLGADVRRRRRLPPRRLPSAPRRSRSPSGRR